MESYRTGRLNHPTYTTDWNFYRNLERQQKLNTLGWRYKFCVFGVTDVKRIWWWWWWIIHSSIVTIIPTRGAADLEYLLRIFKFVQHRLQSNHHVIENVRKQRQTECNRGSDLSITWTNKKPMINETTEDARQNTNHRPTHHHHYLFWKRSFLPSYARVRRLPICPYILPTRQYKSYHKITHSTLTWM